MKSTDDGSLLLALQRWRQRVPALRGLLRRLQTVLFGAEISQHAHLGQGVSFVHTVGTVIGGDTKVGDRVVFLGSVTLGTVGDTGGYPVIGNDVVLGAGCRVLGRVHVGDRAHVGANAVVLRDVPADCRAAGVPAVNRYRRTHTDTPG